MKKVSIKMTNCYGIKQLEYVFDFEKHKNYLIYASNGMMKTSFTKTFSTLRSGKKPSDEVYGKKTTCDVLNDDDTILGENIFVINSYEDEYISPNSAKLMVHRELRQKYDEAIQNVDAAKTLLWTALQAFFGDSVDFSAELSNLFACAPVDVLEQIKTHCEKGLLDEDSFELDFLKLNYADVFNANVEAFVKDPKNITQITEYEKRYNELLEKSPIFKRGVFSHNNADIVSESLNANGFFGANHSLVLYGVDRVIESSDDLMDAILTEKKKIFADEKLKKSFDKINAALGKRTLIQFRTVIEAHPEIIPELSDYLVFKRKIWVGLLNKVKTELEKVVAEYEKCQTLIATIKEEANRQHSQWDIVLDIFKSRFTVPFTISVPNKKDVALLGEMPEFVFKYKDMETGDEQEISRKNLEKVLSQGEKRALFLLNIINDLEALKMSGKEYLIVTDDIAESFDYYDNSGVLQYVVDVPNGTTEYYECDANGSQIRTVRYKTSDKSVQLINEVVFNAEGRVTGVRYIHPDGTVDYYGYTYDEDGKITQLVLPSNDTWKIEEDIYGRLTSESIVKSTGSVLLSKTYSYLAGSGGANASTHFIGSVAYSDNTTYSYTYDAVGNITAIKKNGTTIRSYVYDELNQLIRENNHELLQYVYYTYDHSGNIQSKTSHYWAGSVIEETTYTYGNTQWGDLLTNYNGTAISYDASGNPLNWRNAAIMNWQGRRLNSMALDSGYIHGLDFKYNADGIRTQKSYFDHSTANMYSVSYTLDGTKILAQTYKHSTTGETYTVNFFYDANDAPIAMECDGNYYYYRTNIQGDIEGICNSNGVLVVSYSYDAWGNILSATGTLASTVGEINPFRYRGYYYDTETGWYYLQSRYYDPTVGRFLNADEPMIAGATGTALSLNLFTYCENNPVNKIDLLGYWAVNLKTSHVAIAFDLILTVAVVGVLLWGAKIYSWTRKIFSWAKKAFDKLIMKISHVLVDSIDTLLYQLSKTYNSAGKARIKLAASAVAAFISTIIDLTPGGIVATLLDRFDKDGKSGYIRF